METSPRRCLGERMKRRGRSMGKVFRKTRTTAGWNCRFVLRSEADWLLTCFLIQTRGRGDSQVPQEPLIVGRQEQRTIPSYDCKRWKFPVAGLFEVSDFLGCQSAFRQAHI